LDLGSGRWKKVLEAMDGNRKVTTEDLFMAMTYSSAAALKMEGKGRAVGRKLSQRKGYSA
jgi:hypothetical protein